MQDMRTLNVHNDHHNPDYPHIEAFVRTNSGCVGFVLATPRAPAGPAQAPCEQRPHLAGKGGALR